MNFQVCLLLPITTDHWWCATWEVPLSSYEIQTRLSLNSFNPRDAVRKVGKVHTPECHDDLTSLHHAPSPRICVQLQDGSRTKPPATNRYSCQVCRCFPKNLYYYIPISLDLSQPHLDTWTLFLSSIVLPPSAFKTEMKDPTSSQGKQHFSTSPNTEPWLTPKIN